LDRRLYLQEIQAAYDGEVRGEAFFTALADQPPMGKLRESLLVLARLESQTRRRMEPLLARHGLDVTQDPEDAGDGFDRAASWGGMTPDAAVARLHDLVLPFVGRYDALADAATDEDRDILNFLAAHERALETFANLARAGQYDRALADVLALLVSADSA
jgi:hypothetical protein